MIGDDDIRAVLAEALRKGHAAYYEDPRMVDLKSCQVAALLPTVRRLMQQQAAEELEAAAGEFDYDSATYADEASQDYGRGNRNAFGQHQATSTTYADVADRLRARVAAGALVRETEAMGLYEDGER